MKTTSWLNIGNLAINLNSVLCVETPEEGDNDFRYVHLLSGAIISVRQPVADKLTAALITLANEKQERVAKSPAQNGAWRLRCSVPRKRLLARIKSIGCLASPKKRRGSCRIV